MSNYILTINSLTTTFSIIESGRDIVYQINTDGAAGIFEQIAEGDRILGYLTDPSYSIKYSFDVEKKTDNNTLVLRKIFEVSDGFSLNDIRSIDEALYSELHRSTSGGVVIPIDEACSTHITSAILSKYIESEQETAVIETEEAAPVPLPVNYILFGAPGTGKSNKLREYQELYFPDERSYERVTCYPNYSYAQFVGTYKPKPEEKEITYKFVPGPFTRLLVKAIKNPGENYLLLIEEINRANVTAVFGDIFQLLDRKDGVSEYPIDASEDLKDYLLEKLDSSADSEGCFKIRIPSNMYIWGTMNSADQGVFPLDTAFKRRWDFEYIDINHGKQEIEDKKIRLGNTSKTVKWDDFRMKINDLLIGCRVNEDKLIGPFFLGLKVFDDDASFNKAFKSKLLMYLYEDAAKQHRYGDVFFKCQSQTYSSVCKAYDETGDAIFGLNLDAVEPEETADGETTANDSEE